VTTDAQAAPALSGAWRIGRRTTWWVEAAVAVAGYLLYGLVQSLTNDERDLALSHGRALVALEQRLHVWVEPALNAWITAHHTLVQLANYYYELSHVLVTGAVLVWLWRRHPHAYARWRNALLGLSLVALVVFLSFPVAPPRFAAALVDTLVQENTLGAAHAGGLVDLYAALPSLHVAWAVWVAAAVMTQASRRVRLGAVAYPVATTAVVLTTANHYVVDVLAGASLALGTVAVACWSRGRPAA
jgi:hypothetical protein